jgi:3-(3-hydroxy-phenyl)propionate hydroxylase
VAGAAGPVPLDEVLGDGFAVVGPAVGPAVAADPRWRGLPVRFVRVCPPGYAPGVADGDYHEVTDVDGRLAQWFARHGAGLAVLRPDRFVYAAADSAAADPLSRTLADALADALAAGSRGEAVRPGRA